MTASPRLEDRPAQPYLAIPIQVTLMEWGRANELVGEVLSFMGQQGIAVSGPPLYRYRVLGDTEKRFELEVGWLLSTPAEGNGRITAGVIPAGRYAVFTHAGHPDRLEETFAVIEAWAAGQGIEWDIDRSGADEVWAGRFELFMTNPAEEPDPEKWIVENLWRVRDGAPAST